MCSAVLVFKGRGSSRRYPSRRASRYRRASFVAGSAFWCVSRCLISRSVVVTMFSISELARASRSGSVLTSMSWFGISSAACLRSARAARAVTHRLRTLFDSRSTSGGSRGRSLCGPGRRDPAPPPTGCDRSAAPTFRRETAELPTWYSRRDSGHRVDLLHSSWYQSGGRAGRTNRKRGRSCC